MVYFWLILALVSIGLFWLKRKSLSKTTATETWPNPDWPKNRLQEKLLYSDPWEVASWLITTFKNKDDLWPTLKEVLAEGGFEGIYLACVNEGNDHSLPAVKALGLIGSRISLPALIKALNSKDDEFSLEAMEAIKKLQFPESCDLLIDALITGQGAVPPRAANILISFGDLAKEPILKAIAQVSDAHKAVLIEVLGETKREELWPDLIAYLNWDHSLVRQKTVEVIGLSGSSSACRYLLPLLEDKDWKVRAATAKVLGQLGCKEAIESIKKLCQDGVWHVQVNAREALEELGVTLED